MNNCVFCDIAVGKKDEKYRIIYSDNDYMAMLVSQPETRGHFILYPKKHFSELGEMKEKGEFFELAVGLAEEKIKKLGAGAYVLKLNNKVYTLENDPMHIGHIHVHIVPRYNKDDLKTNGPMEKATRESLEELKNQL